MVHIDCSPACTNGSCSRCHLCVKVRGGHIGGAARTAWELLRRNGITPLGGNLEGAGGDSARSNISDGGSSSAGVNTDSTSMASAEEVGRMERLEAVMQLGKRDSVRRLLKQVILMAPSPAEGLVPVIRRNCFEKNNSAEEKEAGVVETLQSLGRCAICCL